MTRLNRRSDYRNRQMHSPAMVEMLEERALLSAGAELPDIVNTTARNTQSDSANASSANGSSVAVWVDTVSSQDHDIRAQRLDAGGNKIGAELLVANTSLDETQPSVAMDNQGNFVVAWMQTQQNGDTNVLARHFNSAGSAIGAPIQVGVGTFKEHNPSVGMDNGGHFVVAYTRDTNTNNQDVFAKQYDSNNQLLRVMNVAVGSAAENHASIAVAPDGRFDIAWEQTVSPTEHDVMMAQFSSTGALRWETTVSSSSHLNERPRVAMNNFGNAVVAWQEVIGTNTQIVAREVDQNGSSQSGIIISHVTSGAVQNPTVAMNRTSNNFVVAYELATPSGIFTRIAEVVANQVSTFNAGARTLPAISMNGANHYLITYTSNDEGNLNIRGRIGVLS